MENKKIKSWIVILIVLAIILVIPVLINFGIQIPACFSFVGTPENWLMFWPTYLSAAISLLMVIVTFLSLRQNREQLDELKREWDEEHKKELIAYLTIYDNYFYLCVKNISIVPIRDIHVRITHIPSKGYHKCDRFLNSFNTTTFSIEPGGYRYINTYAMKTCSPINDNIINDDKDFFRSRVHFQWR